MIVGHFFLAIALTALITYYRGLDKEECLKLAVAAGGFALLPDLDIIYAGKEIFTLFTAGFYGFTDSFWTASQTVHRGLTHSLITLGTTTLALLAYHRTQSKILISFTTFGLSLFALILNGVISAAVLATFSLGGFYITSKIKEFDTKSLLTALSAGLLIHPFGDIFTGSPPDFFYPLNLELMNSRVMLFEDPVLNFFTVLTFEIAAIWMAIASYSLIKSESVLEHLKPLSLVGVSYILIGQLVNTPTMSTGYQFVFSVVLLSFGASYAVKKWEDEYIDYFGLAVNFLMAMTLASGVYLIQYLV